MPVPSRSYQLFNQAAPIRDALLSIYSNDQAAVGTTLQNSPFQTPSE